MAFSFWAGNKNNKKKIQSHIVHKSHMVAGRPGWRRSAWRALWQCTFFTRFRFNIGRQTRSGATKKKRNKNEMVFIGGLAYKRKQNNDNIDFRCLSVTEFIFFINNFYILLFFQKCNKLEKMTKKYA